MKCILTEIIKNNFGIIQGGFAQTFFTGCGMYKILGSLRTQYWYWFIRDYLIDLELKEPLDSKRKERLVRQNENAIITSIYSKEKMGNELRVLSPYLNLDRVFTNYGDQYRYGTRAVNETNIKLVEQAVPGSRLAHQNGPSGLFSVLEAQSLSIATTIVAKELLELLKSKKDELISESSSFKLLFLRLNQCMFDDTDGLISVIDEIIEYLFPMNKWNEHFSVRINGKVNVGDLEPESLLQSNFFELKTITPIVIGYAFCKAKYFGEIHYLSKVCYKEQYLAFINKVFLIDENSWVFEPPSSKEVIEDLSVLTEGEIGMKHLFYKAHSIAKDHTF